MTFRHLQIFVAAADCSSMSAAAQKLYISQPSVSQAVRELETYFDVRLFERLSHRLYLTEEGKLLLSYARHIIDSFDQMEQNMRNLKNTPHLSVGCSVSVGTYLLNHVLDLMENRQPECKITATVDNTSSIEKQVLLNKLDLAVVEGIIENPELIKTPVCQDELVLVCGRKHPLAAKNPITFQDLENVSFISRESGSAERNQLEKLLADHHISLNRCWNCTNTEAIKNGVLHGRGVAILSNLLVEQECRRGDMILLKPENIQCPRTIHLIYHKNKYLSPAMQTMIDILSSLSGCLLRFSQDSFV